jgi:mono/diheme cytochrome c family protein
MEVDMFSRFRSSLVLALLLAFVLAVPVFAGGWAVITLDELPTGMVAGEPFTIGFTVLQHGRTPLTNLDPVIIARSGSERVTFSPTDEGKPGHYAVSMTIPSEGEWEWTIHAFSMEQKMPALSVAAPAVAVANTPEAKIQPVESTSVSQVMIVRVAALVIGLIGLAIAFWRKSRLAVVLTALCLIVGVGSFMVGSTVPAVEAESDSPAKVASDESISQVELGAQLFVAKGCITCHTNAKVPNSYDYLTINPEGATNLTNFSASPEILRIRLKDPSAAKSNTQMPNLGLSDAEIEALIAFINSK